METLDDENLLQRGNIMFLTGIGIFIYLSGSVFLSVSSQFIITKCFKNEVGTDLIPWLGNVLPLLALAVIYSIFLPKFTRQIYDSLGQIKKLFFITLALWIVFRVSHSLFVYYFDFYGSWEYFYGNDNIDEEAADRYRLLSTSLELMRNIGGIILVMLFFIRSGKKLMDEKRAS